MGHLLRLTTNKIRPTQDYLNQPTIFSYYTNLKKQQIVFPPIPVFEECINTMIPYGALDGHHKLSVLTYLGLEATVWIASSNKDLMSPDDFPMVSPKLINDANEQIKKRYCSMFYVPRDKNGIDINSFEYLIETNNIKFPQKVFSYINH